MSSSWLDSLAAHPVFASSGAAAADLLDGPPSPGASSIAAPSFADDSDDDLTADATVNASRIRSAVGSDGGRRRVLAIVRSSELLVVVDGQLRLASLSDFKAAHEQGQDASQASYKVLHPFTEPL